MRFFSARPLNTVSPAVVSHAQSHAGTRHPSSKKPAVIGSLSNFWLWSVHDGFDLTHPPTPSSPPVTPRLKVETTKTPITIAPVKTALIIIDMQNLFLSRALGRQGACHAAETAILTQGIPAARKAGIRVVWLTWGITDADFETLPPTLLRSFRFAAAPDGSVYQLAEAETETGPTADLSGTEQGRKGVVDGTVVARKELMKEVGIGSSMGEIDLGGGKTVDGGRLLMRDMWNTALHPPLEAAYQEGIKLTSPDVRFHKNRVSGMCESMTACSDFLRREGYRTLLFTGVNTDQCVLATLQDANLNGWDTVLLRDGCATTSPDYAREMCEFNCAKTWGFVSSCEDLAKGVENMTPG